MSRIDYFSGPGPQIFFGYFRDLVISEILFLGLRLFHGAITSAWRCVNMGTLHPWLFQRFGYFRDFAQIAGNKRNLDAILRNKPASGAISGIFIGLKEHETTWVRYFRDLKKT